MINKSYYPVEAQGHHLRTYLDLVQDDFRKIDKLQARTKPGHNLSRKKKKL